VYQAKLDGRQIVSVQLIRKYQTGNAPTAEQPLTEWQSFVMHEENLREVCTGERCGVSPPVLDLTK